MKQFMISFKQWIKKTTCRHEWTFSEGGFYRSCKKNCGADSWLN